MNQKAEKVCPKISSRVSKIFKKCDDSQDFGGAVREQACILVQCCLAAVNKIKEISCVSTDSIAAAGFEETSALMQKFLFIVCQRLGCPTSELGKSDPNISVEIIAEETKYYPYMEISEEIRLSIFRTLNYSLQHGLFADREENNEDNTEDTKQNEKLMLQLFKTALKDAAPTIQAEVCRCLSSLLSVLPPIKMPKSMFRFLHKKNPIELLLEELVEPSSKLQGINEI